MSIKIVISDSQVMFAEGLLSSLNEYRDPKVNVVGIAHSQADLKLIWSYNFDVLIINPLIFSIEDFNWVASIKETHPKLKIVIITDIDTPKIVKNAFLAGVDGYVLKSNQTIDLHRCLDRVVEGHNYISQGLQLTPTLNKQKQNMSSILMYEERFVYKQKLTKREREILELIIQCKNNKEIAKELFISDQTASVHRKSIMKKFGVGSTNALIKFTIENQII
jgi:DNA-binding NarL/FixJ family response regulator